MQEILKAKGIFAACLPAYVKDHRFGYAFWLWFSETSSGPGELHQGFQAYLTASC